MTATEATRQNGVAEQMESPRDMERLMAGHFGGIEEMIERPELFENLQRYAKLLASSDMVPKQFQNSIPNCFVACQLSMRLAVDVFMLMQNMCVVHGRPGFEAKLVIAMVNQRGPFEGPIQYEFIRDKGKTTGCRAYAKHAKTGDICEATVDWNMVVAEGWDKNPKWKNLTDQMFAYRSATFMARRYCPEVILGVQTVDELEDISGRPAERQKVTGGAASLEAALLGQAAPTPLIVTNDSPEFDADPEKKPEPKPTPEPTLNALGRKAFDDVVANVADIKDCENANAAASVTAWMSLADPPYDLNEAADRARFKKDTATVNWLA